MTSQSCDVTALLFEFIKESKDGYAIFCADDQLVYANYVYRDIFCFSQENSNVKTFEDMVRTAYAKKRGINIETTNIDDWLEYVRGVRRKRDFRIFEVDLVDGRWFLFSEQILTSGEMLVQTKDITRQKILETQLKLSVENLNKLALTDELTQLANRRSFVQSVEQDLNRCVDCSSYVTLLAIDLDHFKIVNDSYGHAAGDEVLRKTAWILRSSIRQYDIAGRLGGEEFAVYLGTTDVKTALIIAERIRTTLESFTFDYEGQPINVTASIGLTSRDCMLSFEQLYTEADEALYLAKTNGRNRVELYKPDV